VLFKLTPKEQKLVILLGFLLALGIVLKFVLPEPETLHISKGAGAGGEGAPLHGRVQGVPGEEMGQDSLSEMKNTIMVHVAGAVTRSDVYVLEEGARVHQAIEKAGGALEDADLERINLAQPLYDGQQVIVPRQLQGGIPSGEIGTPPHNEGKININLATQSQFESLPGIGAVKAQSIIRYRQENGYFSSIEDLTKVNGIGEKTLENIKEFITIY
jgi:competence protein ComEA